MADFAFSPRQAFSEPDSDVTVSRSAAGKLRDHLKSQGHLAAVERSAGGGEHRVWVKHPKYKDTVAYAHAGDFKDGKFKPYWIRK